MHIHIQGGELVLPAGCTDIYEAFAAIGYERENDEDEEDETEDEPRLQRTGPVILAPDMGLYMDLSVFYTPSTGVIEFDTPHSGSEDTVYFFRAIDDDDGGREVILAWADLGVEVPDGKGWVRVTEEWTRLPAGKQVVRLYASREEALAQYTKWRQPLVLLPLYEQDGWTILEIHGPSPGRDLPYHLEPFIREALGIGDGVLLDVANLESSDFPSNFSYTDMLYLLVSNSGDITVIASSSDESVFGGNATAFLVRRYTHAEALEADLNRLD